MATDNSGIEARGAACSNSRSPPPPPRRGTQGTVSLSATQLIAAHAGASLGSGLKGAGLFEFQTPPPIPPPPLQTPPPPKVFEPVFLQIEILAESVGATGAEKFFWSPEGYCFFFFTPRVYTQNTQNFMRIQKWVKTHKKFDPQRSQTFSTTTKFALTS